MKKVSRREWLRYLTSFGVVAGVGRSALPAQSAMRFVDVARSAGITFNHDNAASPEKFLIETMGSGCGWIDYDQNGLLDLYLVNSSPTRLYVPETALRSALYRNNGDSQELA